MKELEPILKTVADGLRSMAQGLKSLADKIREAAEEREKEEMSAETPSAGPAEKQDTGKAPGKARAGKTARKAAQRKKPSARRPDTALNVVLEAVKKSPDGIGIDEIMEKTGYDRKKVHNRLYRLKKQGKIKNVSKGRYAKGSVEA